MALSENIKTRRKALKMSQEYVAEQLDISRQAVAKWESGKSEPTTENLVKLAALFEMSVSELVEPENIAEAEATRQEQERERQHNARMLSGRFFAYIFVDAGAMGFFRFYPPGTGRYAEAFHAPCSAAFSGSLSSSKGPRSFSWLYSVIKNRR